MNNLSMPLIYWHRLNKDEQAQVLMRPVQKNVMDIAMTVATIKQQIQNKGDEALIEFAKQYDGVDLTNLLVDNERIERASFNVDDDLKVAIQQAYNNIWAFHCNQQPPEIDVEIQSGVRCQVLTRPIDRIGLYVPGGNAPLFSTVLMLAIPAKIAKCRHISLCSPAPICDEILYAARLCGVDCIYEIGGAGAIFAMAYGTKTVQKVDKIFGPGNAFVTEAKKQVAIDGVAIDMPAGPSELLIIADDSANAKFVASDLLSQAEHGADSQVVLVSSSECLAKQVCDEIQDSYLALPRADIIEQSLQHCRIIITEDESQCIEISNAYAPEHLIIQTDNPRQMLPKIHHAGSVFLGKYSPESMGDYASGTNHVLPTYGYARSYSGLGLADFYKRMTVQELSEEGFLSLAPYVMCMAKKEQLMAHYEAVAVRVNNKATSNARSE